MGYRYHLASAVLLIALAGCTDAPLVPGDPSSSVSIAIAPMSATVAPGDSVTFAAAVSGAGDATVFWSVEEVGGGIVDSAGTYTAPAQSGTYHVRATSKDDPTKVAVASIEVDAAPPVGEVGITLAPSTVSLSTGGTQQFTTTVTGSSNLTVTWAVLEGSAGGGISSTGLYTAPAAAGLYHVVATSAADPTKQASAAVTVSAPPPVAEVGIAVDPTAVSLSAGGTQQFTATVTGTSNVTVTWTVSEGSAGGGINSTGLYTAPSAAGLYHVVATSAADPTKQASATISVSTAASSGAFVSAYYVGYQRNLYPPDKVDFSAFTHLVMGRVTPKTDGTLNTTFDIDATNGPLLAKDLSSRAHAAGRKAILMVGGAGQRANWIAATAEGTRATFVANLLGAMSEYGYDGLDLDWEPIDPTDMPQLQALATELRAASPGIILTLPVKWVRSTSTTDPVPPFVASVASLFDQINVMSYIMTYWASGWESWHSAALHGETPTTPSSVASSADAYVNAGVPKAKLGVGIGFFGQCWRGPTAPHQPVSAAPVAGDNTMSYANIVTGYLDAPRIWDDVAKVPYRSSATPVGAAQCTFISYEDEQSVLEKGAYVKASGLGGAIIWTVNQGYVSSLAANPILDAVKAGFLQ